ncbi:MAG: InlB B-repeat-containing protein, partial [Christensenellaceae bacterium]|nr:InlB B-repeat-containing protein [Christensenellaceae bacterium]
WNHTVTFDKDGVGTGTGFTVKGTNTITIIDGTGKIEYKVVDGEKTSVYDGYIDIDSGIIFRTKAGSYDSLLMLVPTDFAVNYSSLEGSNWFNAMAIAYSADCSLGETHDFTVAVYDEVVYFGAIFVDAEGKTIAAEDCYNADYVKFIKADGTKIVSFARNAEGALVETDGKEGVYAAESHNVKLDGVGGVTIDDAETGTYTISESAEYGYDVYTFTDGKATAYYRLTLGEFTCTLVKPMATLTFTSEYGTADNMSVNVNIECALPVIADQEAFVLKGWSLAGSEEVYRTFVPTGDSYAFTAVWGAKCAVTVSGLLEDDVATYGSFYLAAGDSFVSALPAYTADTINEGYYFAGWYFDSNGNGVIDEEDEAIDPGTVVVDGQTSATVIGEWLWAGNVTFAAQSGYTFVYDYANGYWASNNQGAHSKSATMEFAVTTGKAVVSFEYYCNSESSDKLTIYYGPDWKSVSMGGTSNSWKTLTTTITYDPESSNQKIYISYKKDSSVNTGDDTAYIRNLRINGVLVTAQNSLNTELAGTYTTSDSTQVIVGMGGALQIGENFYGYTVLDENTISATIEGTYKEITLDKSAGTCEIVVPQVNVTYNYMGHGENTTTAVNKFSTQTLSTDVPTAEGYIFRGWYTSDAFTTAASATFTASEDVTFYAKWDAAVTLTFDYNGQGTAAVVVSDKYVGDNVSGIPEVTETFGTKVFAGWFLYDSETDTWGEEASTSTVLTGNTTYYAKWVEPSVFAGTYTMLKVDNSSFTLYNTDSAKLTLDELGTGKVNSWNGFSNGSTVKVTFADGSTTDVDVMVGSTKWYGAYDAASGIIICSSSSSDKLGYSTVVMMVPYNSGYVKADFTYGYWTDTFKYRAIQFTDRNVADTTRSIFIADATTFYTNAEFKAYDGSAIAANNCSTSINLFVYSNETLVKEFAYNGSQLVSTIDSYKGVYTNGTASLFLNGAGIATMGEKSGTYAPTAGNANVLDVYLANNTEYYEVTVDVEAKTFTATQPTVNVTYNYNGHGGTDNTTTTLKNVAYTVTPTSLTEEGFIFRGWYTDEALTTKASSTYTPSADLVFYAKWDAAVTLTFDYNGQGTAAVVVPDKYVGDKVSGIPTVTVTKGEQVFAGWFSLNGTETGEWGEEASTSTVLTGNTTYYAKWITPVKSYGTYKGFEVWSAASGKNASSMSTTVLTMNANGTYTGIRSISGTLSDEDALVENGAINLTRYAYVTNAFGGIVILGYSSNATSVGDDFYIGFKNSANITSVDYSAVSLSGIYTAWLTVSYTEGSTAKTIGILVYNNVIYANVTWKSNGSDVEAKKCASTDKLVIYNSEGQPMLVKDGNTIAGNDGKAGSYENGSAYGTIVLDGYGTLTIGEDSTSYTLDGNVVSFILNNAMRKVTLGDGTYTKTLDGFEGTYTLPDGTTTIVLDGYGNADATKTYVVNGTNITVYDGETSAVYGIDVANKLFLGKSKFAGLTFTGSFVDGWGDPNSMRIVFDDSTEISGVVYAGYGTSYYFNFTAVLEGNVLTFTFGQNINGSSTVGKTMTATISGDTMTITSCDISNKSYTFANDGSVTCSGFSL